MSSGHAQGLAPLLFDDADIDILRKTRHPVKLQDHPHRLPGKKP